MLPFELHKEPAKILIVKPSALGDIVHSLPFLAALKDRFPASEVHWVVAKGFQGLLEDNPLIAKLWVIEKDQWKRYSRMHHTMFALRDLFQRLREERFDIVVDLQGLFRSGVISRATGAKYRIGFKEAREGSSFFYTHKVRGGKDIHAIERYHRVASYLGCATHDLHYPMPPPLQDSSLVHSLPQDYIVIAPAAGGEAKKWPAERFGLLASELPCRSLVVAGKPDEHLVRQVVNASRGKAVSLAGKTSLRELIEIIRHARLLVSNDSGPMHIAAALNVPVFALFGPTNPARTGPYGNIHTNISAGLSCSPCYKRKKCKNWNCMEAITVENVLTLINKEWDRLNG
ncbi:MAG: lipopolysaccharide heptosyltransferase I [Syntrophobacteraceae bacterium]